MIACIYSVEVWHKRRCGGAWNNGTTVQQDNVRITLFTSSGVKICLSVLQEFLYTAHVDQCNETTTTSTTTQLWGRLWEAQTATITALQPCLWLSHEQIWKFAILSPLKEMLMACWLMRDELKGHYEHFLGLCCKYRAKQTPVSTFQF